MFAFLSLPNKKCFEDILSQGKKSKWKEHIVYEKEQ